MTARPDASLYLSLRENPRARLRLFCFPNAGGGVALLYGWFRRLPPEIDLCPVQLPGRENRRAEKPFTRIHALVSVLADVLPLDSDLPFAFLGHSLGALVAFELARELRRRNRPGPRRLVVSSRRAPQFRDPGPQVHQLPEPQFIATLRSRFGAIPDAILADMELLRIYLPVLQADMEMLETHVYAPEPPLDCPISAFGGTEDPTISRGELESWRECTSSSFVLRMFPGDHFFPRTAPPTYAAAIAEDLLNPAAAS